MLVVILLVAFTFFWLGVFAADLWISVIEPWLDNRKKKGTK